MKNKKIRLQAISEILRSKVVGSQDDLLEMLKERNFHIAQATLSRDFKTLKVAKIPLAGGGYKYSLPAHNMPLPIQESGGSRNISSTLLSIDFSGQLAVLKTKPGYANALAWDLDNLNPEGVLGTVAGDDTILIVLREGTERKSIVNLIKQYFGDK